MVESQKSELYYCPKSEITNNRIQGRNQNILLDKQQRESADMLTSTMM